MFAKLHLLSQDEPGEASSLAHPYLRMWVRPEGARRTHLYDALNNPMCDVVC